MDDWLGCWHHNLMALGLIPALATSWDCICQSPFWTRVWKRWFSKSKLPMFLWLSISSSFVASSCCRRCTSCSMAAAFWSSIYYIQIWRSFINFDWLIDWLAALNHLIRTAEIFLHWRQRLWSSYKTYPKLVFSLLHLHDFCTSCIYLFLGVVSFHW